MLRALWDKKYYLKPYYASEPLHSPVLHMLHLKDYVPDMGYRTGDGRGEPPESQRLMASGNEDSSGRSGVAVPGRELESQRLSHPQSGIEHPFAAEMRQVRGRLHGEGLAALHDEARRKVDAAAGRLARGDDSTVLSTVMREANGRHEEGVLSTQQAGGGERPPRAAQDVALFFNHWGRASHEQVLASSDDEQPPSSPDGVMKWWKGRKEVRVDDGGDMWNSAAQRRQRAQERVAAKAHLLDLCFGTLHHHPAKNLVGFVTSPAAKGGGGKGVGAGRGSGGVRDTETEEHERKKEEACNLLRQAGTGGAWL